jgi:MFS transporter, DHA1 family, multidrug resistance protein B
VKTSGEQTIWLRLSVGFVNRLLNFMLAPLGVLYFAAAFGSAWAGLILAAAVVGALASTFIGGHLCDAWGRRGTLMISEAGTVLGYLAMASSVSHPRLMVIAFMLNSCAGGLGFPAHDAVLLDVVSPARRTSIYTINYWSMNLAFIVGAALGGIWYQGHFWQLLAAGASLAALAWLATVIALPETRPMAAAQAKRHWLKAAAADYRIALADGVFRRFTVGAIFITVIELQLTYYVALRLANHFPLQQISLGPGTFSVDGIEMLAVLRILNAVLVVGLAFGVRQLTRKWSDTARISIGLAIFLAGFMLLTLTLQAWWLIVACLLYSLGELMNVPARQSVMADIIDPQLRAKYLAVYSLRPRAAALIASLGVSIAGGAPPLMMAATLFGLGVVSWLLLRSAIDAQPARAALWAGQSATA